MDDKYYLELRNIMETGNVYTCYQPIVSLTDGSIIGYEALTRGMKGSLLERPDEMFATARKYNMVWELELLCRVKAVQSAYNLPSDKKLFLNVDPGVIKDEHFRKGFTRDFLLKHNIDPSSIIFEITEKTAVEDYKAFRLLLENYVEQGYKIAIDDTGSGYSGLKLLAETHPQYIKIDMDLIRNIDKDSFKQELLTSFLSFSKVTNIKLIAEGIETVDEMNMLINIGVPYGQGYYLERPKPQFVEIPDRIKNQITASYGRKFSRYLKNSETEIIGNIVRHDRTVSPDTLCRDVSHILEDNSLQGIVVADEDEVPLGLVMKSKLNERLATQFGVAVYMNRPVNLVMDTNPLTVDCHDSLATVSRAAMARKEQNLYDYIIITEGNRHRGIVTVKNLLEHTTNLELNYARHLSPLTGLPGNILIEEEVKNLINMSVGFTVLYIDLDNFKAYNDTYGFENGDRVIQFTGKLIKDNLERISPDTHFLGHIGGDDFIVFIYSYENIDEICSKIINDFDNRIADYYGEQDRVNGYITALNRHGAIEQFPVMSISIAVITNEDKQLRNFHQISEFAAQVKRRCKVVKKSCYIAM